MWVARLRRRLVGSPVVLPSRCRRGTRHHGWSRFASRASSTAQVSRSGAQAWSRRAVSGAAWASVSSSMRRGEGKATFAQTPSRLAALLDAPLAPRWCESCWASQRSTPFAGTATSSVASGSWSGVCSRPARPSTSAAARLARWTTSTRSPPWLVVVTLSIRSRRTVRGASVIPRGKRRGEFVSGPIGSVAGQPPAP